MLKIYNFALQPLELEHLEQYLRQWDLQLRELQLDHMQHIFNLYWELLKQDLCFQLFNHMEQLGFLVK
jgi:hypothetical protein